MIAPKDLSELLGAELRSEPAAPETNPFHAIVIDSREAQAGDLFVALRGEQTDGHRFIGDAATNGAAAVLASEVPADLPSSVESFIVDDPLSALQQAARGWRKRQQAQVIGITGSVGKTTTREAIAQILAPHGPIWESPRNYNSEIGLPISLLGIGAETRWAVTEIGPYDQEEMNLLCELASADIGVVTNVGPTHLERFGSMEETERIKGTLPASLPASGTAVLNADDERVARMRERTQARTISYGLDEGADVRGSDVGSLGLDGIEFTLAALGREERVSTPLLGTHQTMTALAAAATAIAVELPLDAIVEALGSLRPGSRLRTLRAVSGALVLDDSYNAAPLSVKAALDLLAKLPGRRFALLGDMLELGSEEEAGHREVGGYAVGRCDRLLVVGERSRALADAAWDGGHKQIEWFVDKEHAAEALLAELGADDVVLVKASHGIALHEVVERLVTA